MSFEKKLNKRKRYRKKKVPFSSRQASYIKQIVEKKVDEKPEKKFHDVGYGSDAISNTALIYPLLPITQGVTKITRIGTDVDLMNISYRLLFSLADETNIFRIVMFQWRESNKNLIGITPLPGDIFQYSTLDELSTPRELMSPYNLYKNQGVYKVLFDKHIVLNIETPQMIIEGFINKGFSKRITFENGSGTEAINQIYMMIVSDSTSAFHPTVAGIIRSRYTDS